MIYFNDIQQADNTAVNSVNNVLSSPSSRVNFNTPLLPAIPKDVDARELITAQNVSRRKTIAEEREIKQPLSTKILFSLVFQVLFAVISYATSLIGGTTVTIQNITVDIEWSSFVLFYLVVMLGFCYVSVVTCNRGSGFLRDRKQSFKTIIALFFSTPVIFFFAPAYTLAATNLPQTYTTNFTVNFFSVPLKTMDSFFIPCYNFLFYVLPFLLGVNFTILGSFATLKSCGVKFTRGKCLFFKWKEVLIFLFTSIVVFGLLAFHMYLLYKEQILFWYGVSYAAFMLMLGVITFFLRENWVFYPHHYFLALFLLPVTRFYNPLTTTFQGLALGVFVEGVGRWGVEFLWETKRDRELNDWFRALGGGISNKP